MVKKDSSVTVYKNVVLGKNVTLESGVILGVPPTGKKNGELKTIIGDNAVIRVNTIIYAGVTIGKNFQTGPSVLIREDNTLGDDVVVWANTVLNPENNIGNETRIHAGSFLEKTTLHDRVFVGPGVVFTDDPHPVLPIAFRECWMGATIFNGVVIGGGSTILPHIKIGEFAVIGAGATVTKNIPGYEVWAGNPAKFLKKTKDVVCDRNGSLHKPYARKK